MLIVSRDIEGGFNVSLASGCEPEVLLLGAPQEVLEAFLEAWTAAS